MRLRLAILALLLATVAVSAHTLPPDTYWITFLSITDSAHPEEKWNAQERGTRIIATIDKTWNAFSWGRKRVIGQSYGWTHISEVVACTQLYPWVIDSLTAQGADLNHHIFWHFYIPGCANTGSYTGVGKGHSSLVNESAAAHEFGHTLRLRHAHSYECSGGVCTVREKGDPYSVMGSHTASYGIPPPAQLQALGWVVDPWTFQTVTASGEYPIPRLDTPDVGVKFVRVVSVGGVDLVVRPVGSGFVVLAYRGDVVIDLDPGSGKDFTLDLGQTATLPDGGPQITTLSLSASGARVRVTLPGEIGPTPPQITGVTAAPSSPPVILGVVRQ